MTRWHVVLRRHDGTFVGEVDVEAATWDDAVTRAREAVPFSRYAVATGTTR